jgi:hypothetical protein
MFPQGNDRLFLGLLAAVAEFVKFPPGSPTRI